MLASNDYVIITSMDYSKAFDSIRHSDSVITDALSSPDVPDGVYKRHKAIRSFRRLCFYGRPNSHKCQFGLGKYQYSVSRVHAHDLHPLASSFGLQQTLKMR